MMNEKIKRVPMPAIHPSCAIAQACERTPEPIMAVIMCALAVHSVPAFHDRGENAASHSNCNFHFRYYFSKNLIVRACSLAPEKNKLH